MEKVRWNEGMRAQSIGRANSLPFLPVAEEVMLDHWSGLD